MSSFSTLPLIMNNQTFVSMKQVNNSSISVPGGTNLTDGDFENYLCHELAKQVDPVDLSNNEFNLPNSLTILDTSLNQTTIINNNDTLLVNERFAMKMEYVNQDVTSYDSWSYSVGGGSYITTKVALDPSSVSLYDSNLKIDVSLNNHTQYTDDREWLVDFDRTQTGMNYFACINSNLSDQNGDSPFYLLENSANIYALGNQPNSVYNVTGPNPKYGTTKYFTRDGSGIMVPVDICSNYTLDANFCRSEIENTDTSVENAHPYADSDFNTFKIVQDLPHVTNQMLDLNTESNVSGSALPIQFNGVDIIASVDGSGGTFDIVNIFDSTNPNWNKIGNGFKMKLTIGDNISGGYTIDSKTPSDIFTLDESNLTRDSTNPYLTIEPQNTPHIVDVTNGYITVSSVNGSGNSNFMKIGPEKETMTSNFYNVSGEVVIYTKGVENRVYYPDNGGSNTFNDIYNGTKSSLTDKIRVFYNQNEHTNVSSTSSSLISDEVKRTDSVVYEIDVISASTDSVVLNTDNRNLAKNSSALLVLSTDNSSISLNNRVFDLSSNLPANSQTIQIISIENQCILASNAPIVDQNGSSVSGSNSSVVIQHVNLEELNYQDYRVYLKTKTVTDVSNLLQLNHGWSVKTTDPAHPQMIGNALKTGVIRDDYLFMTNASDVSGQHAGLDISMTYAFEVASPVISGTQAIKHRIAITFVDLSNNTEYDNSETVFYLDDQDITLNPLDPSYNIVEDTSCPNITQSSLNNGTYLPGNYQFRRFTSKRQFTASFDSKFQFYQNLLFVTPTIIEKSVYYQIYDQNGNQLPSYLLKYFQCGSHLLSNVYVSLVDQYGNDTTYSTAFDYTQEVCSIFNVELYGSNDSVNYEPVRNTHLAFLDPFFNFKATINNFDGQNAVGTVTVQLANSTTVNQTQYYIETANQPGTNVSFLAKKYVYTVSQPDYDGLLNNFSYYNDFYNTLQNMTLCDVLLEVSGNQNILTVSDGTGQLVTITHPSDFIDNYNVIVCKWPLFQVTARYDNIEQNQFYALATNNIVEVDDGVFYYSTANPSVGMNEVFGLVSDSFSLKFCNNNGVNTFPNNNGYASQTLFNEEIINTELQSANTDDGYNLTKSVTFYLVRGYNGAYCGVPLNGSTYYDVIGLYRTPSTITFRLYPIHGGDLNVRGTTATQTFTDIYVGKQLTLNNVVGQYPNTQTYNLGLVLNIQESILSNTELTSYLIDVEVADYLVAIIDNPYDQANPNDPIIGVLRTGYLTDIVNNLQIDLLYPYIDGVRACSIKADSVYTLTITRSVPDLRIYSLNTPSYIGNPLVAGPWKYIDSIDYNQFLWTGYTLSNLTVRRLAAEGKDGLGDGHVVFYNSYYSYYVVAPPSVSVFGYPSVGPNKVNVYSLPISGFNPIFFKAFDISEENSYTDATHASSGLTFRRETPYYYANYLTIHNPYYFQIQSNYMTISLYTGGVGTFGPTAGPDYVDTPPATPHDTLYSFGLISDLTNNNYFTVTQDTSLNYNIAYKQILYQTGSHNQTANILFTVGNPFTGPNTNSGVPSYYLRLPSPLGTSISFYQANIIYSDVSENGIEYGYYMVIDRFDTIPNINYNQILQDPSIREVFFPVQFHETKQILLGSIVDENGNVIDQQTYLDEITYNDVSNADWISDTNFTTQYIGITISALSNAGANNIASLLQYNPGSALEAKALYVKRQDAIRLMNVLGNNLFRVTNSGNVQTQRVVTSNVSLYTPPNVMPNINSNIAGAADIISIFAQDTILNTGNPSVEQPPN